MSDEWLKDQIRLDTLKAFRIGCDEKNFKILNLLPTTIDKLQKELQTKGVKPIHDRVNQLEEMGLLIRQRGTGKIETSQMTSQFLKEIGEFEKVTSFFMPKYRGMIEEKKDD